MAPNRGGRPRRDSSPIDFSVEDDVPDSMEVVADHGVYFSADGRRRDEEMLNVSHKKRRVKPSDLDDSFGLWTPVPDDDFQSEVVVEEIPVPVIEQDSVLGKRKHYASSNGGLAKTIFKTSSFVMTGSRTMWTTPAVASVRELPRIFKCRTCGAFLMCEACCLAEHKRRPLHMIEEWDGTSWINMSLKRLGLVYQLGHGGLPCVYPDAKINTMTVLDVPYVHQINFRYCKCARSDTADNLQQLLRNSWWPASVTSPATCAMFATLELYRLLNVIGNLNVHDFIKTLERSTNATASTGMDWLPHRYTQTQRMTRQWAFSHRAKRRGRGHDPTGVAGTQQRELGVECWTCPHDGRNIPLNWRDVDPKYKFLYMLLLAMDANFKLKNRMRPNEIDDPPLGPGWGYFVEPQSYRRHLKTYVPEKDITTCIAFAALLQKDTRMTKGLRCSGVGGAVCSRHECMRAHGLGNLQKGERYVNMDFILMACLVGFTLAMLTVSYDIACQWEVNLAARNQKLPTELQLPLDDITVQCALPVWHAGSHEDDCRNQNSLSFKKGVGKSDGEGVERTWAVLNPASYHTKDAGKGVREDVLEDKIDSHNFLKNIGQGDALQRKLVVAIAEQDRQIQAFKACSRTVELEVQKLWQADIDAWLADKRMPNPYALPRDACPTEAETRLELKKDETAEAAAGGAPVAGTSAVAFLVAGVQLEDAQRRIIAEVKGTTLVAADRLGKIQERRTTFFKKLVTFRRLQLVFMPGATAILEAEEALRDPDSAPIPAEAVKLLMPHEMPLEARATGCNALVTLRTRLHAKRHFISYRNANVTGQNQSTKAATLIAQIGERVDAAAAKYRKGREALVTLRGGEEYVPEFRALLADDVRLDGDWGETDGAARKKLAMIGVGRGARAPRNAPGTSKRVMSWIWTAPGVFDDAEKHLHASVRVEWARAQARKHRWVEEVMLLREEMRRVLRYLTWQADWWDGRAGLRTAVDDALRSGLAGYAAKEARWHRRLRDYFRKKWDVPALVAARHLAAVDRAVDSEDRIGLDAFFTQDAVEE
ncbi:hypothetical protein C8J57DRAFT_1531743 [Mycena rebaudengoi]|nr:hypothetical protein C8J57DRAFT_1531743 [Mycena rebaudengoi]